MLLEYNIVNGTKSLEKIKKAKKFKKKFPNIRKFQKQN